MQVVTLWNSYRAVFPWFQGAPSTAVVAVFPFFAVSIALAIGKSFVFLFF